MLGFRWLPPIYLSLEFMNGRIDVKNSSLGKIDDITPCDLVKGAVEDRDQAFLISQERQYKTFAVREIRPLFIGLYMRDLLHWSIH